MAAADKIKELRSRKNISQDELANAINKTRAVVSHWERGITPVTIDDCTLIANYFNIPIEEFVSSECLKETSEEEFCRIVEGFFLDKTKTRDEIDNLFRNVFEIYAMATKK